MNWTESTLEIRAILNSVHIGIVSVKYRTHKKSNAKLCKQFPLYIAELERIFHASYVHDDVTLVRSQPGSNAIGDAAAFV
jgi:hypothetical protein